MCCGIIWRGTPKNNCFAYKPHFTKLRQPMPELISDPPKDYSWAEYLDFMEGGADILSVPPHAKEPQTKAAQAAQPARTTPLYGFLLTLAIMVAAICVSELPLWPFT